MRVLVTGGSGFIGVRLLESLVASGCTVRATHRRALPPPVAGVQWYRLPDVKTPAVIDAAIADSEVVIHLAALTHQPWRGAADRVQEFTDVNVTGTRLLARAAARRRTQIHLHEFDRGGL